jgi:uncharacterized repeat protein (TIGR01451 family)
MGKLTLHKTNRPLAILLAVFVVTFLTSFAAASANMYLLKTADPTTYSTVGQNIEYTYTAINIGSLPISGTITVTDDHISGPISIPIPSGGLLSNHTASAIAYYTINQTDLNNGYVTNSAYATNNGIQTDTYQYTVTANQRPALTITKIPSIRTYGCVGQNITYTYIVTNSGNVDLQPGNITVTDNITGTLNINDSSLKVGQSVVATANYTITPGDLCACSVTNNANATCNFTNYTGITYQVPSNNITVSVFNEKKKCCETCGCYTCGGQSRDGSDGGKGFCGQEKGFKAKFKSTDQINEDENMCHTKNIKEKKDCEWQDRGINENTMIFKPIFSNIQKEERWGIHQK